MLLLVFSQPNDPLCFRHKQGGRFDWITLARVGELRAKFQANSADRCDS